MRAVGGGIDVVQARRWRRELHQAPEFGLDTPETARFVARALTSFGVETHVGIGGHRVVGVLPGRPGANRCVALRADMDALQIAERNSFAHASKATGLMHACGHDGHTEMLLAAASLLAQRQDRPCHVVFIFQPGEEHGLGAQAMFDDGLFERFAIDELYALHNLPGLPVGVIAIRPGPIMASEDNFEITLDGRGGHAARPHMCDDLIGAGCQLVVALQGVVARRKRCTSSRWRTCPSLSRSTATADLSTRRDRAVGEPTPRASPGSGGTADRAGDVVLTAN